MGLIVIRTCIRAGLLMAPVVSTYAHAQDTRALVRDWDTYSDTWVAMDGLQRALPTFDQVGRPRTGRTLGMFYFLTLEHGLDGPFDNSKILLSHPEALNDIQNPAWGPLNTSHHWGEPLFGYYASDDRWVLRKHAQMLANAGVDMVVFDNSNAVTYDKARNALCEEWEDIRRQGGKTPQIAFLCPFGNPDGIGTLTLDELYDTLYEPGKFSDLWFRWNGKPLVLADPSYANADALGKAVRRPAELGTGSSLGQSVTVDRPIRAVGGEFPTWATRDSGFTMSLFQGGPGGLLIASRHFDNVSDNATVMLDAGNVLPRGHYYLEISHAVGKIGWWSVTGRHGDGAYEAGQATSGHRIIHVLYDGEAAPVTLFWPESRPGAKDIERAKNIREFFTFRSPIAPYDLTNPPRGAWTWLQNYPQAVQTNPEGLKEQISVGVAQNYNASTHLAPMSFPGAFGRSYHDGKTDTRPDAVQYGFNFAEQWKRALQVDPPFVFVTGWNEWTAGFYDKWDRYQAPPAIFVDEFNEENSRDIEPMRGGHGDDYYYQLVANERRYKGVRELPPVTARTIRLDGRFDDWQSVQPEYRDAFGDTVHRNAPGFGHAGPYVNDTGRNDIVAAKVSYDKDNVYFYVRTKDPLSPSTDPDWMLLYLSTKPGNQTGWLGYDFVVNRLVGVRTTSLERSVDRRYSWEKVADIRYVARANEMELAIPRSVLGVHSLPATIDFKWADHCFQKGDWTDFVLNGDAAPDDRFNYRATLQK
ncbi:MAG: hypothetical protein P4L46_16525 [Fimbriimonas sp.]|nr:hypothetical protein [Fimbriimonas sp.]